ncbi:hypothetical protein FA95DRAFT_1059385 [Auriscalpium vulgare]|uniref:Uncharacterized protein n=1 Tax=Auriscalpium vulgare TaxID=40419 RepID=A0ACB8SB53_9AGAM|nr:hypothetical protein FA95DRAFT_1059385 [Auriscalpium vulgare]
MHLWRLDLPIPRPTVDFDPIGPVYPSAVYFSSIFVVGAVGKIRWAAEHRMEVCLQSMCGCLRRMRPRLGDNSVPPSKCNTRRGSAGILSERLPCNGRSHGWWLKAVGRGFHDPAPPTRTASSQVCCPRTWCLCRRRGWRGRGGFGFPCTPSSEGSRAIWEWCTGVPAPSCRFVRMSSSTRISCLTASVSAMRSSARRRICSLICSSVRSRCNRVASLAGSVPTLSSCIFIMSTSSCSGVASLASDVPTGVTSLRVSLPTLVIVVCSLFFFLLLLFLLALVAASPGRSGCWPSVWVVQAHWDKTSTATHPVQHPIIIRAGRERRRALGWRHAT